MLKAGGLALQITHASSRKLGERNAAVGEAIGIELLCADLDSTARVGVRQ